MSSIQLKQMAEFYKEARSRFFNSNIDLATQRDVVERLRGPLQAFFEEWIEY